MTRYEKGGGGIDQIAAAQLNLGSCAPLSHRERLALLSIGSREISVQEQSFVLKVRLFLCLGYPSSLVTLSRVDVGLKQDGAI